MNKVLSIINLVCLLFIYSNIYAEGDLNPNGKIKGAVVDAKSNKPIEYATVALSHADNNELITGVITDYLGHFKIDKPKNSWEVLFNNFIYWIRRY